MGLKSDGSVVVWGDASFGQPSVPAPNASFTKIAGGGYHCLGLKTNGSIVAWGRNDEAQCNVPGTNSNFTQIAGGGYHSLGLKTDGSIVAWGRNTEGQCNVPAPNNGFIAIACGQYHSLGLKNDGTLRAWGLNNDGQCTVPSPNIGFVSMAVGWAHSVGLKSDGTLVAWGRNNAHQLDVPLAPSFFAVAAGGDYSLGLRSSASTAVPETPTTVNQLRAFPNPTRGAVSFLFTAPAGGSVSFRVLDIGGRLVRSATSTSDGLGDNVWRWDVRDDSGKRVPAGIYFFVVQAQGASRQSGKVVVSP